MSKKKFISAAIIFFVVMGIVIWWRFALPKSSPVLVLPVEKMTIAAYPDYAAAVYLAEAKGFFGEVGLDVDIKTFESGRLAMDAMERGEADVATAADVVFVSDRFERDDLKILGTVTVSDSTHEIIGRKDRGVNEIADMKGKRIGVTKKSSGEFFLGQFFEDHDLKLTDVNLVDLRPSGILTALEAGDIDAAATWEPTVFKIKESLGLNATSFSAQGARNLYFLILSMDEFVSKRPEALSRFMRAMKMAEKFMADHPDETKEFVGNRFRYNVGYLQFAWPKFRTSVGLPQQILMVLEEQARWRIANHLTEKTEVPNYLGDIYFDSLNRVDPGAITIIR